MTKQAVIVYKLTDQRAQTHGGYQWVPGEWHETDGAGNLCSSGWLHCYSDPLIAVLLNPIHANIDSPQLWRAEADGEHLGGNGLKEGYTRLRVVEQIEVPQVTTEQRVRFAIACAWRVYAAPEWREWASGWLCDRDRSAAAASAAAAWARAAARAEASAAAAARAAAARARAAAAAAAAPASAAAAWARAWARAEAEAEAAPAGAAAAASAAAAPLDLPALARWALGDSTVPDEA